MRALDGRLDLNCRPTYLTGDSSGLLLAASYPLIVSGLFPAFAGTYAVA